MCQNADLIDSNKYALQNLFIFKDDFWLILRIQKNGSSSATIGDAERNINVL